MALGETPSGLGQGETPARAGTGATPSLGAVSSLVRSLPPGGQAIAGSRWFVHTTPTAKRATTSLAPRTPRSSSDPPCRHRTSDFPIDIGDVWDDLHEVLNNRCKEVESEMSVSTNVYRAEFDALRHQGLEQIAQNASDLQRCTLLVEAEAREQVRHEQLQAEHTIVGLRNEQRTFAQS